MTGNGFSTGASARSRGLWTVAGSAAGLCILFGLPAVLTGCGSSGTTVTGAGSAAGLGRAAAVVGTYAGTQTGTGGQTEETTFEFTPGPAFETLSGSFTQRILSPRSAGGNDLVSFSSGTLTGNILADGSLHVVLVPDSGSASAESRSVTARRSTRQTTGGTDYHFTINGSGNISGSDGFVLSRTSPVSTTYLANSIAGTWTGNPSAQGGFQVLDPRDSTPVGPATSMSVSYALAGNKSGQDFTAAVTLADPTSGKNYTASGVHARIYTHYDTYVPTVTGLVTANSDSYFVVGNGTLPANAGSVTVPNVPVLGSVSISLANRPFLFEAGVGPYEGTRLQLGVLYIKVDETDPIYSLLPFAGINPDATSGYIMVGEFGVLSGKTTTATPAPTATPTPKPTATPSPTPTPSPAGPAVGTVQFSDVTTTNATTTPMTNTDAAASFIGAFLNASLTASITSTTDRVLSIELGSTTSDSSLAVGTTFPISSATVATGFANVSYIEEGGVQKFWVANGGSVVVTAHDSKHTTLKVVNATMIPTDNYGASVQPTGTFTINAAGTF